MRISVPKVFLNPISFLGAVIVTVSLGASTVLLLLDVLGTKSRPYLGILTFFLFPSFLVLGLVIVPLGALWNRLRLKKRGPELPAFPVLDFNQPRERRFYLAFGAMTLLILLLSALGGYQAYEFTESVTFCGQTCHSVMEPQFTTYQNSPHARVKCVECHVGSGAGWYLKAKVSGLEQVYATLTGTYPRPIPTPVKNLRPAQDTCEQCHWPNHFFGTQLALRTRYGYDALNSQRQFFILLKTGGGGHLPGQGEGIHWHMNLENKIEYMARNSQRTEIAWVGSESPEGQVTEYIDPEKPPTAEEIASLERRQMDCMDCHNRPAHMFLSPEEGVDRSFQAGLLDPTLPYLKEAAVAALSMKYSSFAEAETGIEANLKAFYAEKRPALLAQVEARVPSMAEELRRIYRKNFFPGMAANWAAHPDHIGHREFPGCFRCHDDRHRSADGRVLKKDCALCHTFATRSAEGMGMTPLPSDGSFLHPWKHERHSGVDCWTCHNGSSAPYQTCGRCHEIEPGAPMAFACSGCHKPLKVTVQNGDCTPCHDAAKSKLHARKEHQDCLACHKQHEWKTVSYPDDCTSACHGNLEKPHHPGEPCSPCHDFRGVTSLMSSKG